VITALRSPARRKIGAPKTGISLPKRDALDPSRRWSSLALAFLAIFAVAAYGFCRADPAAISAVKGDGEGYYAYLPGVLLEHDASFRTLVTGHPVNPGGRVVDAFQREPSGYLVKYSYGVALLASPFFAVGHIVAAVAGQTADGYSSDEEFFAGLGAVVVGLAGLFALRAVLRRRFGDGVVAVTLLAMTLGTGLLHWMVYDPMYSHAYSFGAIAMLLLTALRFRERPESWRRALACGLAAGLVILIRIPNLVVVAPIVLLGVIDRAGLIQRVAGVKRHFARVAAAAACALVVLLPQEIIWEQAMGRWLSNPYVGEGFTWLHPQLRALYSGRPHGLLLYAPVLALALLGLPVFWRRHREWRGTVIVVIVLDTYLLCAWHIWFLGVGFGQRGFVDIVPVFALPFAGLLSSVWHTRWRLPLLAVAGVLTATTMLGMLGYWTGALPHVGATAGDYISVMFGGHLPGGINAN